MTQLDRPVSRTRRAQLGLLAVGVALKVLGLAVIVAAFIATMQVVQPGPTGGIAQLFFAIGGFLAVAAGADLRSAAISHLRAARD